MKKKIVFCEIAWMKNYKGVTEDDKPMNGGKYIAENGEGGEVYNFSPINHTCYGYVMHYGNELHIERYDKILESFDEVRGMTVVWVASDGKNSKIVGWYENAAMYRFWQEVWGIGFSQDYNFTANEKDCYLIDADQRTFVIPRATIAGKGRGMGQSQVWYADSAYAQDEFIPKVFNYLDRIRDTCKPCYYLPETLEARAKDTGKKTKQLLEEADTKFREGFTLDALALANLALDKDDCYDTRFAKSDYLVDLALYDEAEEELKQVLYHKKDIDAMCCLMYIENILNHTFLAIELGEEIRKQKNEVQNWRNISIALTYLYINEGELDKAQILMQECEQEENAAIHDWIPDARKYLEECRE